MSGNAMRYIIGLSFAALAVWVLQATGILMAIAVFLMVGAVPGTSISVPPTFMLIILLVLALCAAYWMIRQRPIRQIKELKQDYEKAATYAAEVTLQSQPKPHAPKVRDAVYAKGFASGFQASHLTVYHARQRMTAGIVHVITTVGLLMMRFVHSLYVISVVIAITIGVATRALVVWLKPHFKHAISWLKIQATYSLKGTASAHTLLRIYKKIKSLLPKRSTNNSQT